MTDWQPIETAPEYQCVLVKTTDDPYNPHGIWVGLKGKYGWQTRGLGFSRDCQQHDMPTHWMPLPKPPGGTGTERDSVVQGVIPPDGDTQAPEK